MNCFHFSAPLEDVATSVGTCGGLSSRRYNMINIAAKANLAGMVLAALKGFLLLNVTCALRHFGGDNKAHCPYRFTYLAGRGSSFPFTLPM